MAQIRYSVAMSLDGYIAGPRGEYDWIIADPDINFSALMAQFEVILVGKRTFETMVQAKQTTMPGIKTIVVSTTLNQKDYPEVTIINNNVEQTITALRAKSRKDIWLFGGGELFRRLLQVGLVDTVEIAIEPVLLGGGIPMLPLPADRRKLHLKSHRVYKTGIVRLEYGVGTPAA